MKKRNMLFDKIISKYRWIVVVGTVAITALLGVGVKNVETETDLKNFIPEKMPSRVSTERIEEVFGGTDLVMVIFQTDDILNEKSLERIRNISKGFNRIKEIDKTISLFDSKHIYGEDGAMVVESAVSEIPSTSFEIDQLRDELIKNELVYNIVVSEDFTTTVIMGSLDEDAEDASAIAKIDSLLEVFPGDEMVFKGGMPYIREVIDRDITRDFTLLMPLGLLLMLLMLYFAFREKRGVVLPFGVVVLAIIFSLGLFPLIGWKLTLITILLPVMLIAVANDYGIHIIARYQELNDNHSGWTMNQIVKEIFRSLRYPIILTGLTTICGILGLLAHTMIPARQLGVITAIGIGFALVLSLVFIPAVLSMLKKGRVISRSSTGNPLFLESILEKSGFLIVNNPRKILWASLVISVIALFGCFLIEVDTNIENFFPENHPVKSGANIINNQFGGSQNIAIMFEGDVKDPALLKRLDTYEQELTDYPGVGQVISIASVIKIMSKALNDSDDPYYDVIPDSREAVAQYLELYSMSADPEDFESFVDFDYTKALLLIRIDNGSNNSIKRVLNKLKSLTLNDAELVAIGGMALSTVELADMVVQGQYLSLIFAILVVGILMMVIFRSFSGGLVSIIPLMIAIIILFGIMGYSGIKLDIVTAILSSIMIGVGVDYTIHFLWRYKEELEMGLDHDSAVIKTLLTTGRGITFNALSVIIGFSVLIFSTFIPIKLFGFLIVTSIATCLIGALVVVPAIVIIWKPEFLEPKISKKQNIKFYEKDKCIIKPVPD